MRAIGPVGPVGHQVGGVLVEKRLSELEELEDLEEKSVSKLEQEEAN